MLYQTIIKDYFKLMVEDLMENNEVIGTLPTNSSTSLALVTLNKVGCAKGWH